MALIYDSSHSGQEIDSAVDAVQTTIPQQLTTIGLNLGNLANLTTTAKNNIVAAVNEVKAATEDLSGNAEDINYTDNYGMGADNVQDAIDKASFTGTETEIDLTQYTPVQAWPASSGKWDRNHYGYFIPITPYSVFKIVAQSESSPRYAFLKNNVAGSSNSSVNTYATGCSTMPVEAGGYVIAEAPFDASYLWVSQIGSAGDQTPQSVSYFNISSVAKLLERLKDLIGTAVLSFPQTFTPVTTFGKAEAVKVMQIPVSGTYVVDFHINDGYTTTVASNSDNNWFSLRTYATDLLSDTTTVWMKNYARRDFTNSSGEHIYKFEPSIREEVNIEAGQWLYYISRLNGTGYVNVTPKSTVTDRLNYLEEHMGADTADPDTSSDDVATNKKDAAITMLSSTFATNTRTNMLIGFFSDIHGDVSNVQRVIDFCEHYDITCILHGGDSVNEKYGDGTPFDSVTGAKVLNIIGNHDSTTTTAYANNVTDQVLYETFMAYFASSVIMPEDASTNYLCYWYKDYASQGIRLIGINCMRWTTAQATWLEEVLDDAVANSLAVIIVSHYPADEIADFDTPFNSRQWSPAYQNRTLYLQNTGVIALVDTFIEAGGEFVCYLTGHQHRDHIGTCTHAVHPQVQLTLDSSSMHKHARAIYGTEYGKNSISFDILGIDRYEKSLRVVRIGRDTDRWMRRMGMMNIDYVSGCLFERYKME